MFMIVKQLLVYNPTLKVILMSATPHDNMFQAYFNCEIKQVEGRNYSACLSTCICIVTAL